MGSLSEALSEFLMEPTTLHQQPKEEKKEESEDVDMFQQESLPSVFVEHVRKPYEFSSHLCLWSPY